MVKWLSDKEILSLISHHAKRPARDENCQPDCKVCWDQRDDCRGCGEHWPCQIFRSMNEIQERRKLAHLKVLDAYEQYIARECIAHCQNYEKRQRPYHRQQCKDDRALLARSRQEADDVAHQ